MNFYARIISRALFFLVLFSSQLVFADVPLNGSSPITNSSATNSSATNSTGSSSSTVYDLNFYDGVSSVVFGHVDGMDSFTYDTSVSGLSGFDILVFDNTGTQICEGLKGSISVDKSKYPLTFKIVDITGAVNGWRVDVNISASSSSASTSSDYTGILNTINSSVNSVSSGISNIVSNLSKFEDFLDNPSYLQSGINDLSNSVSNMENISPINVANSSSSSLSSISVSTSSKPTFFITIPHVGTFNVLDFSNISSVFPIIRNLMSAMLWIAFFIYLIRYFMPQFKV